MRLYLEEALKPYKEHLKKYQDLKTSYEETRAVFVELALEKNRLATPYVAEARALKQLASKAKNAKMLLKISKIWPALITAAGISDKALNHLNERDLENAVKNLIEQHLEPAGEKFVEELVFRFLLTRGDSLGGSMRNLAGKLGEYKLIRSLLGYLSMTGTDYKWLDRRTGEWLDSLPPDADIEKDISGMSWETDGQERILLFNKTIRIVRKNIDLILLNCSLDDYCIDELNNGGIYLALGELKGGIDPAGADEHWKTARSSLERIKKAFSKTGHTPATFFVGAAIEDSMAREIWAQLETGALTNAGNLTDPDQLSSLVEWLCNL